MGDPGDGVAGLEAVAGVGEKPPKCLRWTSGPCEVVLHECWMKTADGATTGVGGCEWGRRASTAVPPAFCPLMGGTRSPPDSQCWVSSAGREGKAGGSWLITGSSEVGSAGCPPRW